MDESLQKAVESADDTGMIAEQEQITQAELGLAGLTGFPEAEVRAKLPGSHQAHAAVDALQAEVARPNPDRGEIERHVGHLRSFPELEAIVANWWDDPKTQRFVGNLGQIGL